MRFKSEGTGQESTELADLDEGGNPINKAKRKELEHERERRFAARVRSWGGALLPPGIKSKGSKEYEFIRGSHPAITPMTQSGMSRNAFRPRHAHMARDLRRAKIGGYSKEAVSALRKALRQELRSAGKRKWSDKFREPKQESIQELIAEGAQLLESDRKV
jgi:hypothetical protein